jgi:hypothetical protein
MDHGTMVCPLKNCKSMLGYEPSWFKRREEGKEP